MQKLLLLLFILIFMSACSAQDIKRSTYDALHNKQCMDETGTTINCDPDRMEYIDYKKQREGVIKKDSANSR